jgi:hypothetical protein
VARPCAPRRQHAWSAASRAGGDDHGAPGRNTTLSRRQLASYDMLLGSCTRLQHMGVISARVPFGVPESNNHVQWEQQAHDLADTKSYRMMQDGSGLTTRCNDELATDRGKRGRPRAESQRVRAIACRPSAKSLSLSRLGFWHQGHQERDERDQRHLFLTSHRRS